MPTPTDHQLEYMRPDAILAERERAPYIYIPIGAVEWHGHHNAVGLDALKAHAQLCRVAEQAGGIVYPAIFSGTYTGGRNYPHTYMVSQSTLLSLLEELLVQFEQDGYTKAILLGGHYPNYHFAAKVLADRWQTEEHHLELLPMVENRLENMTGDHAGHAETSMMLDLLPDTVDLETITHSDVAKSPRYEKNNWLETRFEHPCHGVVGIDPRHATATDGKDMNDQLVAALAGWITTGDINLEW